MLESISESHAEIAADFARLPINGNTKVYEIGTTIRLQGHTTGQFSTERKIEGIIAESLRLPRKVVTAKTIKGADRVRLRESVIVADCPVVLLLSTLPGSTKFSIP